MPSASSQVKFSYGLQANYNSIELKDVSTVYFCTDTQRMFVGDTEYTRPVLSGAGAPSAYQPPRSMYYDTTNKILYMSPDEVEGEPQAPIQVANFYTHPSFEAKVLGPTSGATLAFGGTFQVPSITTDTNGHVTAGETYTFTLPQAPEDAEITITPASASGTVVKSVTKTPETTTGVSVEYVTPGGSVTGGATTIVTGVSLGDDLQLEGTTQAADTDVSTGTSIPTTAAVKSYVDNAVGSITDFGLDSNGGSGYATLDALKEAHATGEVGIFYLVVNPDAEADNAFLEYFWTGTAYELAGQFGSVNTADFATKTELAGKVDKTTTVNGQPLSGNVNITKVDEAAKVTNKLTINGQEYDGSSAVTVTTPNDNTTYTFANGEDGSFTVTPSTGGPQTVTIGKPATAGTADKVANTLSINDKTFDGSSAVVIEKDDITALGIPAADTNTTYTMTATAAGSAATVTLTAGGSGSGAQNVVVNVADGLTVAATPSQTNQVTVGIGSVAAGKITGAVAEATKATQDGDGNVIDVTYATKTEVQNATLVWSTF